MLRKKGHFKVSLFFDSIIILHPDMILIVKHIDIERPGTLGDFLKAAVIGEFLESN